MEANDPVVTRALKILNDLLVGEPEALRTLMSIGIPIGEGTLTKVPELVTRETDPPRLSVLGLLNTILGPAHGEHAVLASEHLEKDGPILRFIRAYPSCEKCATDTSTPETPRTAWGYGLSDAPESWENTDSREEAIQRGRADYPGEAFYIVEGTLCTTEEFLPSAESIVMEMNDRAQGEAGEAAEDWPDVTNEGGAVLDKLLDEWARKYITPPLFWVANGEPERIEPEEKT